MTAHGVSRSERESTQKSWASGAPRTAPPLRAAVRPGTTSTTTSGNRSANSSRGWPSVNACIAGADEGDGLAALRRFQRPAAAVQLLGHAGGVIFLFPGNRGARDPDRPYSRTAPRLFARRSAPVRSENCGSPGPRPTTNTVLFMLPPPILGHRGGAPAQRSRRRPPVSGCGWVRPPPAQPPARTHSPLR